MTYTIKPSQMYTKGWNEVKKVLDNTRTEIVGFRPPAPAELYISVTSYTVESDYYCGDLPRFIVKRKESDITSVWE